MAIVAVVFLAACSKNDNKPEVLKPLTIELASGDDMKFVGVTEFNVKIGQEITLILKNTGKLPKEAMSHNIVILTPETDLSDFNLDALKYKDQEYIPPTYTSSIVAHTKLLGPGESDVVKFKFDKPGIYHFVCSFPGHWHTSEGTFTVL